MSNGAELPIAEGGNGGILRVALIERQPETLQSMLGLAHETRAMEVKVLHDAAAFFEVYGRSAGPDILLVGLDSDPQDALAMARRISALAPACGIVVYVSNPTIDLLSQAMTAGARRYLTYPVESGTLLRAVRDVHEEMKPLLESTLSALPAHVAQQGTPEQGMSHAGAPCDPKVITVFSPKGGVGTSTLAVNLACALASMSRRVAIIDGNISFGNVGIFLNIAPSMSMLQVVGDGHSIQESTVDDVLLPHPSGVKVVLAPLKPEEGDAIRGEHLRQIADILRSRFDYVVIDTWPSYDERVLAMLEVADQVLVPTGPELPSIKNLAAFLRVARLLEFPDDKLIPVLIRANSVSPGYLKDIEGFLQRPLVWRIVSDGKRVTQSVNNGEPFVLTDPTAPVSQNIFSLARMLDGQLEPARIPIATARPFWKRPLFGLRKAG